MKIPYFSEKNSHTIWTFVILSLFVLISFIYPGYTVLTGDQQIYLPQLHQVANPALFSKDMLSASFSTGSLTLFSDMVVFVSHFFNIDLFLTIFLLSLFIRFLFYFALYRLAYYFTQNRVFSLLVPLIYIVPFYASNTGAHTLAVELLPKDFGLTFSIISLVFYFNKKYLAAFVFLSLALLLHILSVIPFVAFFVLDLLFKIYRREKPTTNALRLVSLISLLAISLFAFIHFHSSTHSQISHIFTRFDPVWLNIVKFTNSYSFAQLLNMATYIQVFQALIFFIIIKKELVDNFTDEKKEFLYVFLLVPVILVSFMALAVDVFGFSFFASLQLGRTLLLWQILLPLLFSFYAFSKMRKNPENVCANFLLIGAVVSLVAFKAMGIIFLPGIFLLWLKENNNSQNYVIQKINTYVVLAVSCLSACVYIAYSFHSGAGIAAPVQKLLALVTVSFVLSFFTRWVYKNKIQIQDWYVGVIVLGTVVCSIIVLINKPIEETPPIVQHHSFNEMCSWLKDKTAASDVVQSEPFSNISTELRFFCDKNIFYSVVDEPQSIFDRSYAIEYVRRKKIFNTVTSNEENAETVLAQEGVNYIVSDKEIPSFKKSLVFKNDEYEVYRLK